MKDARYSIFADYHQLFVTFDKDTSDIPEWSDIENKNKVAQISNGFVISTARNMEVYVTLSFHSKRPDISRDDYDHIAAEFEKEITNSKIYISGTSDYIDDFREVSITKGSYGFLIGFKGLDSISEDGLDGSDSYHINLWPLD